MSDPVTELDGEPDPLQALAESVAEHLRSGASGLGVLCKAADVDNPIGELDREDDDFRCLVTPGGSEEELDGSGVFVVYTVWVVFIGKVTTTRTLGRMRRVAGRLRRSLRHVPMGRGATRIGKATYAALELFAEYDLDELHEADQFMQVSRVTYRGPEHTMGVAA